MKRWIPPVLFELMHAIRNRYRLLKWRSYIRKGWHPFTIGFLLRGGFTLIDNPKEDTDHCPTCDFNNLWARELFAGYCVCNTCRVAWRHKPKKES